MEWAAGHLPDTEGWVIQSEKKFVSGTTKTRWLPTGWVTLYQERVTSTFRGWNVHPGVCPSQIAIPVMSVTHIKKTKTAILVPNALVIATANDRVRLLVSSHYDFIAHTWTLNSGNVVFKRILPVKSKELLTHTKNNLETVKLLCLLLQYVFVSFLSRDNTYKILMSVCLHLEVGQTSHMQPYIFSHRRSKVDNLLTLFMMISRQVDQAII